MDWQDYSDNFRREARERGRDVYFSEACLRYARVLFDQGLPIIYDQRHLAALLGFEYSYVLAAANRSFHFYRRFYLPKKGGGHRCIDSPARNLKEMQRWILDQILAKIPVHNQAMAYRSGLGIKDNAREHLGKSRVLRLDISNFFPSITFKMVYRVLAGAGYSRPVTTLLSRLCAYGGSLPQGAPSSPALSNLVFLPIDRRLAGYAAKKGLSYSRYADDLIFSGDFDPKATICFCRRVLAEYGFTLNESKLRVMRPHQRQTVTGLVVNERLNVSRKLRRQIIQQAHYIGLYGLQSHLERTCHGREEDYLRTMKGRALFALDINPKAPGLAEAVAVIKNSVDGFFGGSQNGIDQNLTPANQSAIIKDKT